MNRTIYPRSSRDRKFFWLSVFNSLGTILALSEGVYWIAGIGFVGALAGFFSVYVLQDEEPKRDGPGEYSSIIARVAEVSGQLSDIGKFLERQQTRIADAEATLTRLTNEKETLEPIVLTHKETVEAILSAYSVQSAKNIWKERLIGFLLGTLASVIASVLYDYFQH